MGVRTKNGPWGDDILGRLRSRMFRNMEAQSQYGWRDNADYDRFVYLIQCMAQENVREFLKDEPCS